MTQNTALGDFVNAFAAGIQQADRCAPVAVNHRSGKAFQPGIGPHPEAATIELAFEAAAGQLPPSSGRSRTHPRYGSGATS